MTICVYDWFYPVVQQPKTTQVCSTPILNALL